MLQTTEAKKTLVVNAMKNKDNEAVQEYFNEMIEGVKTQLEKGSTKDYKEYLEAISTFTKYSLKNNLLILSQMPNATFIASYNKWKELGRSVNKGAKAIYIRAPLIKNIPAAKNENKVVDPLKNTLQNIDNLIKGIPIKSKNGLEGPTQVIVGFRYIPVFDMSQTSGKRLPEALYLQNKTLTGTSFAGESIVRVIEDNSKVPVKYSTADKDSTLEFAAGYFSAAENKIVIDSSLPMDSQASTLLHEMAHSVFHNNPNIKITGVSMKNDEIEAESIAYIVGKHYGIDSGEDSFKYIGQYIQSLSMEEFSRRFESVVQSSNEIINMIDQGLEEFNTSKKIVCESIDNLTDYTANIHSNFSYCNLSDKLSAEERNEAIEILKDFGKAEELTLGEVCTLLNYDLSKSLNEYVVSAPILINYLEEYKALNNVNLSTDGNIVHQRTDDLIGRLEDHITYQKDLMDKAWIERKKEMERRIDKPSWGPLMTDEDEARMIQALKDQAQAKLEKNLEFKQELKLF